MHRTIFAVIMPLLLLVSNAAHSDPQSNDQDRRDLLEPELKTAYESFVRAIEKSDVEAIRKLIDPSTVNAATTKREAVTKEYGDSINTNHVTEIFDKRILNVRRDGATNVLVRTRSTALWYTKDSTGNWRITRYLDKPIE